MLQTAIVANRVSSGNPDTQEIRELTEAAGATVVGEVAQTRESDPGTELGRGKVQELATLVEETGADTVVIDAALSPQQTVTLEDELGTQVVDRHRLVLEIFANQARTRRAQLQVELARLNYRLPRIRERADEGILNRLTESGTPYYDVLDRIDELERKLNSLPAVDEQHREQRREQGFDLVAIAGYTNAGKTTLLRRLAADLEVDEDLHPDLEGSAAVGDRLFKTLETTTRRATIDGRDVLLTDTVGFIDDLPHWLVESFRGTLTETTEADAVIVVADIAQPVEELERKLKTVLETLGDDCPPVVTALNKADCVDNDACETRLEAVEHLAPNPVVISAECGPLDNLFDEVLAVLPELELMRLCLELNDDTMALLSRIHDEAVDVDVAYEGDTVTVECVGKPAVIERLRGRASILEVS